MRENDVTPWSWGVTAVLAVIGALAPAAMVAAVAARGMPLASIPAVTFGVPAMTAPALYVALTLVGDAPPMTAVAAALGRGLLAIALVQLGLAVPVGFLVATASPETSMALVRAAAVIAGGVALVVADEALPGSLGRRLVLWTWLGATGLIAARLYGDALGVTS